MDFNNLDSKLKRLYSSLGEQYNEDISSNIVDRQTVYPDGRFEHTTTFGANNTEKNQNLVMNSIHLMGSLKDIIKRKLKEQDKNPDIYEELIDRSLALSLVADLDNKDKHGDPLTISNRSKKDPKIVRIQQGLRARGITKVSGTTNFMTGKTTVKTQGNVKIVVTADIVDSAGKIVMSLSEMLDKSLITIQTFIKKEGLI